MAPPETLSQLSTRRRRAVIRFRGFFMVPSGGLRESTILDKMKVRKIVKLEEEEACVICQGDLCRRGKKKTVVRRGGKKKTVVRRRGKKKAVVPILHNCGHHQFHAKCMRKWLKRKNTCPLCNDFALNVRG